MSDESLPRFVDRSSSLDLFILFYLLNDEVKQNAILKHSCIEWAVFSLTQCDFDDFDDLVVEQVV